MELEGGLAELAFTVALIAASVLGVLGVRVLASRKDGSLGRVRLAAICVALLAGSAAGFLVLGGILLSD